MSTKNTPIYDAEDGAIEVLPSDEYAEEITEPDVIVLERPEGMNDTQEDQEPEYNLAPGTTLIGTYHGKEVINGVLQDVFHVAEGTDFPDFSSPAIQEALAQAKANYFAQMGTTEEEVEARMQAQIDAGETPTQWEKPERPNFLSRAANWIAGLWSDENETDTALANEDTENTVDGTAPAADKFLAQHSEGSPQPFEDSMGFTGRGRV